MDRVHVSVDRSGILGPPWTDAGADNRHGGAVTGAQPPAAPVRQSSPVGAQNGEGGTGSSSRRTGDDGEGSVVSALGEREVRARREGNESGERCGEAQRG
jgi:hypothetical protein